MSRKESLTVLYVSPQLKQDILFQLDCSVSDMVTDFYFLSTSSYFQQEMWCTVLLSDAVRSGTMAVFFERLKVLIDIQYVEKFCVEQLKSEGTIIYCIYLKGFKPFRESPSWLGHLHCKSHQDRKRTWPQALHLKTKMDLVL